MRHAVIKDGKVVDIMVVGWNYQKPEDLHLVKHDTANIGDEFDGVNFSRPKIRRSELLFHASRRANEYPRASFRIGHLVVNVERNDHETLARLATRARANKSFYVEWPQPRDGTVVPLTADQIIALDEAVTDHYEARTKTLTALLRGIDSGLVKNHAHIDAPPPPIPPWPPRREEPAAP